MSVPYQAYKSKRNSRQLLAPALPAPEPVSDLPPPPPPSVVAVSSGPPTHSVSAETPTSSTVIVPGLLDSANTVSSGPAVLSNRTPTSKFRHVPFRKSISNQSSSGPLLSSVPLASSAHKIVRSPSPPFAPSTKLRPPPRSDSLGVNQSTVIETPFTLGNANVPAPFPSLSLSDKADAHTPTPDTRPAVSAAKPYRPGFQPKGLYRHRTDEYIAARDVFRNEGKINEQRLERRLDKLIELHFGSTKVPFPNRARRNSSFLYLDMSGKSPGGLLREMIESRLSVVDDMRESEQAITPWQNDKEVTSCPICSAAFHPLSNRKHHCRVCGRIICALPMKSPNRMKRCSVLFIVDREKHQIEQIEEGVDYGVRRRSVGAEGSLERNEEKFLRGVRICQDCRPTLLKKQYILEAQRVPLLTKLHDALMEVEQELEISLSAYRGLAEYHKDTINEPQLDDPLLEAHSKLMKSFAEYEALAQQIRQLPSDASNVRIQRAITTRASIFLQKNMVPVKALPHYHRKLQGLRQTEVFSIDQDALLASKLQPLLEQEAILENFIEEARSRRKFDDVKTLAANLDEIRAEIATIGNEIH